MAGDPFFAQVAEDTLQYVARDMTSPDGAFYSAEDADACRPSMRAWPGRREDGGGVLPLVAPTRSGACWPDTSRYFERRTVSSRTATRPSIRRTSSAAGTFCTRRGRSRTSRGRRARSRRGGRSADRRARQRCSRRGSGAPRPERDDKVLTAWNGLMIAATARAARVLDGGEALQQTLAGGNPGARHLGAARRAAEFVRTRAVGCRARRSLRRRYRGGEAAIDGFAEDYACLVVGSAGVVSGDGGGGLARLGDRLAGPDGRCCSRMASVAAGSRRRAGPSRARCGRRRSTTAPSLRPPRWRP